MRSALALALLAAAAIGAALLAPPEPLPQAYGAFEPADAIPGPVEPSDWFYRQRAFPEGRIDQAAFVRAQREAVAMRRASKGGPAWEFAGPTNIGGRVTSLAVESWDRFYAGTGSGGLFKTTDGGASYAPVGDGVFSLSIGDVALDPQNPETVWVGTGEANGGGGSLTYGGSGVYRSRDGGRTWEARGLDRTGTIGRVVVDPTDSDRLWVAAAGKLFEGDEHRGVYRTTDGGGSWERVLALDDTTGAIDLAVDPSDPDRLFAATWTRQRTAQARRYGGPGSALWRSTDGGGSWERLGGAPLPSGADVGRIGVSVAASRPDVVYAVYTDATGNTRGTFRSRDGGDSWTRVGVADNVSYGWWFGQIRADPTDPETVYVPWLNLYRSTNGGAQFAFRSGNMHVDHHALWIDPSDPRRLVAGNDGGVYRSSNAGQTWTKSPGGFPATQFYTVEIDATDPRRLYGGTQDNGTNRTLTGATDDWARIFGGDGHYVLVDPSDNRYVYAEFQYGNLFRSTNGGSSFVSARPSNERANWSAPLAFSSATPSTLYFGMQRVWRSTDRGVSWSPASPDLSDGPGSGNLTYGTVTTIDVSPADPQRIWAGTDDGNVWTTADGAAWTDVSAGLPERWVTRVTAHPTDPLVAVATLSGYRWGEDAARVYRTDDAGATWQAIDAGLPEAPANDVLFDPADPDRLFLATDVGMFWSQDGGGSWNVLGSELPMVPVNDLDLDRRTLVAATYGRGMYALDLSALTTDAEPPAAPSVPLALRVAPNPARASTTLRVELAGPARVEVELADLRGRVVLRDARELPGGEVSVPLDVSGLAAGVYVARVRADGQSETARLSVVR